ncbi:MAG: ribosome-associated translation inhibitor RaiA [Bacteroidales bacterium]|jgi:ribosomal subunit interface protein|nr:ribosome-associated translation inhibitor RaiA [Bacteroidales bacterium]
MNITFNSVRFKADQKLEKFISEKLEKLAKVHDGIIGFDVTLKLENTEKPENKSVEIRAKIRGNDGIAQKTAKTFEEAADDGVNALKKQLLKAKDKIRGN